MYMNFVQPAGEWCVELLHADWGAGVVRSFNYGPFIRSFICTFQVSMASFMFEIEILMEE
ncbi:hypothetical protein DAPPUDRAFT_232448 [Daphnia pulex]|uniref:Uncharacterized protein n=1 Tax=Daphnia pulex TaxID=6669 RepID=E9FQY7_DAPPU|nr:hypothetical protein DAPPUDRAFT_232448 [Daphnia pulex]|eukprot:EFX90063.1 hypothetical protein DAPPUDRAFT_232448 [Daphnia pulex]